MGMNISPLTYIIGWPLLAAIGLVLVPRNYRVVLRFIAVAATFISMVLAIKLFIQFDSTASGYQFVQQVPWVAALGISYHVGVDGLNIGLILMTAIVAFAATCVAYEIQQREKEFYILLMLMVGGILGAFASLDLVFFYGFHELALVPTFIMIGVWGRGDRKQYAAYQITIYLSVGALLVLVGLIALYLQTGARSFDLDQLTEAVAKTAVAGKAQSWIFALLLLGFGILVGLWPFYSWAPAAYSSAPTATAMLHAGAIKKFGLYGLLRIALPLLPAAARDWAVIVAWLCLGNILLCGLMAMRQKDLNYLVSYSSLAHIGFIFLGLASLTLIGITGMVTLMVAHGFLAALLFATTGWIRLQTKTLEMSELGGLLRQWPFIGAILLMAMLAGCGLPGFANFVGELLVFFGAWNVFTAVTILAVWGGLIIGAVYMLRAARQVLHGPALEQWAAVTDVVSGWRKLPFVLLLSALLLFGCIPGLLTSRVEPAAAMILNRIAQQNPALIISGKDPGAPVNANPTQAK